MFRPVSRPVQAPSANALRSGFPQNRIADTSKLITAADRSNLKWKFLTETRNVLLAMLDMGQVLADISEMLGEIEAEDPAAVVHIRQVAREVGVPELHAA